MPNKSFLVRSGFSHPLWINPRVHSILLSRVALSLPSTAECISLARASDKFWKIPSSSQETPCQRYLHLKGSNPRRDIIHDNVFVNLNDTLINNYAMINRSSLVRLPRIAFYDKCAREARLKIQFLFVFSGKAFPSHRNEWLPLGITNFF